MSEAKTRTKSKMGGVARSDQSKTLHIQMKRFDSTRRSHIDQSIRFILEMEVFDWTKIETGLSFKSSGRVGFADCAISIRGSNSEDKRTG